MSRSSHSYKKEREGWVMCQGTQEGRGPRPSILPTASPRRGEAVGRIEGPRSHDAFPKMVGENGMKMEATTPRDKAERADGETEEKQKAGGRGGGG